MRLAEADLDTADRGEREIEQEIILFGIASAGAPRQVWTEGWSLAFSGSSFRIGT